MKEKLKVYQTTDNYTPYWTFVNLVNYIFQDIEKGMFYYPISNGETPQVETKHLIIKVDVRRAMYLSIDEDYLKYGHLKNDNEFKKSYNLHVGEMIDYLEISADVPQFHTSYNPKDDYRLTIFAISDSIKIRIFNDEIIEHLILLIENGMPLNEDLNRLAKDKLKFIGNETLTDFLDYHLMKYNGEIKNFIKNLIGLTQDIWKGDTPTNILKRQTFTTWKEETKRKYNLKESDFKENSNLQIVVNQKINVFDKMNKKYPFIGLTICLEPAFWVYNNYAYVYQCYLESYKKDDKWEIMGDYQKKPLLDSSLAIEKFGNLSYIQNDNFVWVDEVYYEKGLPFESWNYSEYAINCFSAHYELNESEAKGFINDEIYNIEVRNFESTGLCPDSQELDLVVKEYLENIITKWTNKNIFDLGGMSGVDISPNRLYAFFDYHFEEYQGDMHDFVNHSIELVKGLWNVENVKNTNRQKCFDFWVEDKIVKNNLDRSKLKLEQKNVSETSVNQTLKVFGKMNSNYPLIELVETEKYPFWVYNNFANLLKFYAKPTLVEGKGERYFYGDPVKGYELQTQYSEKSQITFIKKSSFDWVVNRFMEDLQPVENFSFWKNNDSIINIFSAKYEYEEEFLFNIQVYDFEENGLYPNPEKLDLVVKDYLKDIDYEVSASEINLKETDSRGHFTNLNKIYSFFDYHFNKYQGEPENFIKHSIELTNDLWKVKNLANRARRKDFDKWVEYKINKHDLDVEKINPDNLEKNKIDNETGLPFSLIEINAQSPNGNLFDYIDSELYLFLNENLFKYNGSVYEYLKKIIDLTDKNWHESLIDINRKSTFKEWLNSTINSNNLDRSKLGLEPIATLEPTQPIKKGIPEIELVKEDNSIDDTLIIIPLIELIEPNVPVFWSYYNYAQLYKRHATRYMENGIIYYRHNENRIGGSIESLGIKYLKSLKLNIVESFPYDCDNSVELINTGNGYLIGFFSAQHEISKTQVGDINYYDGNISERLDKIQIHDFEGQNLYPNPEHIDLVVKYYLKIIEPTNKSNGQLFTENYIRDFFNFHLHSYLGNVEEFVKHAIKITKEVWEIKNVPNRNREIYFNFWLDETIKIFDLDRSKLGLEPVITPEPPQVQNDLENKKLTLTGSKVTIYHVFKQLIAKKIIGENAKEVAGFLIQNFTGFENDDIRNLATEITRDRKPNLEKGNAGISRNNRIDLD